MMRLQRVYKEFLYSNPSNFLENVGALEANFIDAQLRAFRCQKTRNSIFIKDECDVKSPNFIFGISPKLEDYFYQVEFFFELSDAIESFEFNCPDERAGQMALRKLRIPHSTMPHEKPGLVAMWEENIKNIFA